MLAYVIFFYYLCAVIEIKPYIEHAVLVGLITPTQQEDRTKEYLDEPAFLADPHGIVYRLAGGNAE